VPKIHNVVIYLSETLRHEVKMQRVTLKAVAAKAGVSFKTVSYVLNNGGSVTPATREAVMNAVQALNYQPNQAARNMRLNQSFTITFVSHGTHASTLNDPGIARILPAAITMLERAGYSFIFRDTQVDGNSGIEWIRTALRQRLIDGAIVLALPTTELEKLAQENANLVVLEQPNFSPSIPVVWIKYREGISSAVQYLAARNRRRIAFVGGPSVTQWPDFHNVERYAGYQEGLKTVGLGYDESLVVRSDYTYEGGRMALRKLLPTRPDAIVVASDRMAIGILNEAKSVGLRIPEDVAIVGFDDHEFATFCDPQLTTVHSPLEELGMEAAKLLLARLKGHHATNSERVALDTTLIQRSSA
jgi:LacI family transcriptional regulator